ncbi:MAG: glutamate--tRNA ligase [Acidobacteria bacterium]|nr:MAG: glutamate--tRNA ligase [Acidobacteriota bacterium]
MPPRVRFAPSPTGYLHVGGARTALFNWLYARRHGGAFILRIEDTDVERSSTDMVTAIFNSMKWLGLDWDEGPDVGGPHGPYFQTERLDKYRAAGFALVASGHAYRCFCKPEDLKAERSAAEAAGRTWNYDRRCQRRSAAEVAAKVAAGEPSAIRFLVPPGITAFDDLVHGRIEFDNANIEDFVVIRSDDYPTYHLSVVVDDVDMQVSDVVRGDDHISNTPKQVLLYHAMHAAVPRFAHVPLIMGPDKKRLSKRHGATSVGEYEAQGYLPEAMVNFLALLGWSPGGDQEIFSREELIQRFDLEGISGGNAVFNPEKLDWFNQQHIMRMSAAEILGRLRSAGLMNVGLEIGELQIEKVIDLLKPRSKKLADFVPQMRPFLSDDLVFDEAAVKKHLSDPAVPGLRKALASALRTVEPWTAAALEETLRAVAAAHGVKAGVLIHATRVAVTGQGNSPGLFEVLELVGRDRVIRRLELC